MVMAPHAGYVYSGKTAGQTFAQVKVPAKVLLLGPNHRGLGKPVALSGYDGWQTPLGTVTQDEAFTQSLLDKSNKFTLDNMAHEQEHGLEVLLPFLQFKQPNLQITALSLGRLNWSVLKELAQVIALAIKEAAQPVLIVASTDMTHYLSAPQVEAQDRLALQEISQLNPFGLCQIVQQHHISMCGVLAVALGLEAAIALGAGSAELVEHSHSGMVNGDKLRVVGYAGMVIS
jgi:AmmeMemoRadiSam system protein B